MSIQHWTWSITGVLFLAIAVGFVVTNTGDSSSAPAPQPNAADATEAPDFALDTVSGDTFHLADHRGTVVVLNFWATWCPPCRREIPDFVALQDELGDEGLQFVGVALEREAGPDAVRAFADDMNINYPVGLGDGTIAQKYGGVRGLPMTFVIGRGGDIRQTVPGIATENRLRPILTPLLSESP